MKLVGLTGGVGSGKSTVADMMRELGAQVVDADEATHAVYEPGSPGFDAVVREFGDEYVAGGRIDRARLGELVFHDDDARRRLNSIVHPLVRDWMAQRTAEAAERGAEVVVQDVPLLFENGLERLFSTVVLVYAPEHRRPAREQDQWCVVVTEGLDGQGDPIGVDRGHRITVSGAMSRDGFAPSTSLFPDSPLHHAVFFEKG